MLLLNFKTITAPAMKMDFFLLILTSLTRQFINILSIQSESLLKLFPLEKMLKIVKNLFIKILQIIHQNRYFYSIFAKMSENVLNFGDFLDHL